MNKWGDLFSMARPLSFFPTDLATDLDPLPMEDRGVYLTFMRHCWPYGGPMPIDEVEALIGKPWLSCGLLLRRRFTENDGRLSLLWMEENRAKSAAFSEMQSNKGKLGGRPSKGKKPGLSRSLTKRKPNESPRDGIGIGIGNGKGIGEGTDMEQEVHLAEVEPTFEQWWTLYAKSRDKAACQAKWRTIPHETHVAIMEHTRAYVAAQPDKLYRKDPIRYLKNEAWNDEVIDRTKPTGPTHEQRQAEVDRLIIERYGPPKDFGRP